MNKHFAKQLRECMRSAGDSQTDLARVLGVSRAGVCKWLAGHTPRPEMVSKIAKLYKIPESVLLYGSDNLSEEDLEEILTAAYVALEEHLGEDAQNISIESRAKLLVALFNLLKTNGSLPDNALIDALIQVAR